MHRHAKFKQTFKTSHVGQVVDDEAMGRICENMRIQNFSKDETIFLRGDAASHYYLVLGGWVKLFRETMSGGQGIVDIVSTGHVFGDSAMFENDTYTYSAQIVEDAQIAILSLATLKREIESHPKLAWNMLRFMAKYTREQEQKIEQLSLQSAAQRLGCFMLKLANGDSRESVIIDLPYDKALVAARLGMQPETFSRALKRLGEDTGIVVRGATIQIPQLRKLADYTCSACSSEFPCEEHKA